MALIRGGEGVEGTGDSMCFLEKQENLFQNYLLNPCYL